MNLHLLRTFTAVATHGSFSRAAQALHITQPAVSKGVRDLEFQLGITLLERGARQLRLTEAGEALHEHAKAIFALERAAQADLRARQGLERGNLTVGASMTIATYLLPPLVARFLARHPGVEVKIVSDNTAAIERRLLGYELDAAFVEGPTRHREILRAPWREDELVILAAGSHPLSQLAALEPERLARERWIIREAGSGTRTVTETLLRDAGIEVTRVLEVDSVAAAVESTAAGLGLTMVSRTAARQHLTTGRLRILKGLPVFRRPLYRIGLRHKPLSPAAQRFIEMADEAD
ncbi:LysR family transcriptional regulator [Alkalilimnicola sp. S0819]|uniref:LysR family transcriptional regulator n=1 Tax=Alkalilimnicola sp. S0819 TaxID=2613922 RepID=UPI001262361B|nr:LysR family transcriptional regulator [Alkalilimnicola sp. S0819]KAB7623157.1 LysR family transcriptional regulator [Alkalilimnicola sp. S0819]MPQ17001.1 LysR family transcriptional regulator [Alkalilimnicola sp. S0819]